MAKTNKIFSATKCPEPLNTVVDLAAALSMGLFARHQVKKDYQNGLGEESAKAAMLIYGAGAMRRGAEGLISLGGIYGVNSALREIEKEEKQKRLRNPSCADGVDFPSYKTNDNRYAWRLNCEDGSPFGVSPSDYGTREAYNQALSAAKAAHPEVQQKAVAEEEHDQGTKFVETQYLCCRVSRLDNGANEYYLTDDTSIKVGDTITVQTDSGTTEGVVIGTKLLSEMATEDLPKETMWILSQEDDEK